MLDLLAYRHLAALLLLLLLAITAHAAPRSAAVRAEFRKAHPCPSTGRLTSACPGWEVDHRIALMCGGPDTVENLQWLAVEDHRKKTARERRDCRSKLR